MVKVIYLGVCPVDWSLTCLQDVLDDNDFVSIVLETDRPNPSLEQAEVRLDHLLPKLHISHLFTLHTICHLQVRYVTSQVPGGKLTLPEEYLHLDGGRRYTDPQQTNTVL